MKTENQLLREALDNLQSATSWALGHIGAANYADRCREARRRVNDAFDAVYAALANPAEGGEVCNVKSSAGLIRPGKVDAWVANHYTTPPASHSQAQQPTSLFAIAADRAEVAKVLRRVSRAIDVSTDERTILCHAAAMIELDGQAQQPEPIQTAPSFAQLKQILDNLARCHTRDSKVEFLRTWIRDWTRHKIEQRG